jgi:hypothetical protein
LATNYFPIPLPSKLENKLQIKEHVLCRTFVPRDTIYTYIAAILRTHGTTTKLLRNMICNVLSLGSSAFRL